MSTPTSNRLKSKHEAKDERSVWKVVLQGAVSGVVRYGCSKLINERTLHYLLVKVPDLAQKLWDILTL